MALSDAAVIALARELYPAVTVSVVSDAYLTAWLPWARGLCGPVFGDLQDTGVAMLLAHKAYRGPLGASAGNDGNATPGAVTQVRKRSLGASFVNAQADRATDMTEALLATTGPGQDFQALRDSLPGVMAPTVSYG